MRKILAIAVLSVVLFVAIIYLGNVDGVVGACTSGGTFPCP